ncbi:MAG: DUF1036 domain-containing protein [Synechococcus sp. SB0678_bin_12]|nr:DUF1036 domain-containing protein [Synechococcus sp. SB0678_bin_12]MYI87107.1 DUF1036 domain-containing protein [Synechococcus sp. SB0672_bin_10]
MKLYTGSDMASTHDAIGKFLGGVVLLASALAVMAPEPVVAGLEFCNRTHGASTLALALAHYNFGTSHVRSSKDDSPDLTIIVQPRWTIRGWWEIPQHECVTAIDRDPDQTHYYYYAYSQDDSYNYSGDYQVCGRRYGRFHVEYKIDNNELVQILALKSWGIDTASVDSETGLEGACADLGYELLPFNQVDVGDTGDYTLNFTD